MNAKQLFFLFFAMIALIGLHKASNVPQSEFVAFQFKNKYFHLTARNTLDTTRFSGRGSLTKNRLDTLSNIFYQHKNYIEIIRQDFDINPTVGVALGFEFDESNGEFPYTPAHAVIQIRDFRHGGVLFEKRDSLNFTGVSNEVSDDLDIEIVSFENDTIVGTFHGLLINAAGGMQQVAGGHFKIYLFRK